MFISPSRTKSGSTPSTWSNVSIRTSNAALASWQNFFFSAFQNIFRTSFTRDALFISIGMLYLLLLKIRQR